jgi:hypothetical protein
MNLMEMKATLSTFTEYIEIEKKFEQWQRALEIRYRTEMSNSHSLIMDDIRDKVTTVEMHE